MSKIEWTEETWNPIVGCSIKSPGCTHCYAMGIAYRLQAMNKGVKRIKGYATVGAHYDGLTAKVNGRHVWTGKIARAPTHIWEAPLKRQRPTMWFVNSMGDLFHEAIPEEWILQVLDIIRRTSWDGGSSIGRIANGRGEHTYQVLTKRAERMRDLMSRLDWDGWRLSFAAEPVKHPLVMKNLWLGVSAERQQEYCERVPLLMQTPAEVRFVSAEPLLGPISIWMRPGTADSDVNVLMKHPDWIIVGGESGHYRRPFNSDWARAIRDQCKGTGIKFFMKQTDKRSEIPADLFIREMPTACRVPGTITSLSPA